MRDVWSKKMYTRSTYIVMENQSTDSPSIKENLYDLALPVSMGFLTESPVLINGWNLTFFSLVIQAYILAHNLTKKGYVIVFPGKIEE